MLQGPKWQTIFWSVLLFSWLNQNKGKAGKVCESLAMQLEGSTWRKRLPQSWQQGWRDSASLWCQDRARQQGGQKSGADIWRFSGRKCPERKGWDEGKQLPRVKELQINEQVWLTPLVVRRWSGADEGGSTLTLICFCQQPCKQCA